MKKKLLTGILLILIPILATSQWSDNPYDNTLIVDTTGSQILPKVVSNSSGETYISWFSEFEDLNFDVYLQKLDKDGKKLWDKEGLLLSDNQTKTWVTDYDMILDADQNLIIATQDTRTGTSNVFAYKISPDGEFLWGDNGIQLSNTTGFDPAPQVTLADNNELIFAWSEEPVDTAISSPLTVLRVTPEGDKLWETVLNDTIFDYMLPQLLFTSNNELIVSWITKSKKADTMPGEENWMHVFAQKINWEGTPIWENNIQIDSGQLMSFLSLYTTAYLSSDENGGAYVMWQSFFIKDEGGQPTTYINRIYNDGTVWAPNGYSVSQNTENYHAEAKMEYLENIGKLMICWNEYHYDGVNQIDCWGVYGQLIDSAGQYLWNTDGHEIVPLLCSFDTTYNGVLIDESSHNNVVMIYNKNYLSVNANDTIRTTQILAKSINANGEFVWTPPGSSISLTNSNKYQKCLSNRVDDQWVIAWSDNVSYPHQDFNYGIYAQNLNVDGKIGPLSIATIPISGLTNITVSPNPSQGITRMSYQLATEGYVTIELIDMCGRIVKNHSEGYRYSGSYSKHLNITDLKKGIYIIDIQCNNQHYYHKIIRK
jgi:type IX secretion system substrate protein